MSNSRRDFLKTTAVLAGGATLTGCAASGSSGSRGASSTGSGATATRGARPGRAKNIIFMCSDGMSTGTLTLADRVRRRRTGQASNWVSMWDDPRVRNVRMMTHSADSLVTDSAAAGSAWGIGRHINNGAINITPDGQEPEPILLTAKASGFATGLVTTTRITHATPAAFACNVPRRNLEDAVAEQLLQRPVDLMLGGGARHFSDELLANHADVTVVRDAAALRAAAGDEGRLLGLFNTSHLSYELDREENEPPLADMTRVALDRLSRNPTGFVLQVEGGRVDHAAHSNDAGAMVADQLAFDDAVAVAWEFARNRDDTLLVVTTDHANANPGLTLYGEGGNEGFDRLMGVQQSFEWINRNAGTAGSPRQRLEVLPLLVKQATGIDLTDADRAWLARRFEANERCDGFGPANQETSVLGAVLANHLGVSFVSPNHTADDVELTAFGPGSETLRPMTDNIELYGLMTRALGVAV